MRTPQGEPVEAGGEYTLIERPHRLAFTWTFDDEPSNQQLIEIEFVEEDGGTRVVFVNSDISGEERRDAQDDGWGHCFDELGRVVSYLSSRAARQCCEGRSYSASSRERPSGSPTQRVTSLSAEIAANASRSSSRKPRITSRSVCSSGMITASACAPR